MGLPTPNTRREQYLNAIATGNAGGLPTPITREEEYLYAIAKSGGGGGGTTNYNALDNKPQIAGTTLQGNKTLNDLGIAGENAIEDVYAVMGEMGAKNLIPYPYYQTTQTVAGITTTDNGDGTLTFNGTCTAKGIIFRLASNDANIEIPLGKDRYILTWVESSEHNRYFRVDVGLTKSDDTTEVKNGESGIIEINNTNNQYKGIFAVSVYSLSRQTVSNLTFKPMLRLASDTDDTYQQYAKTNKQLTNEIANKVDKEEGKGLSTNDYSDTEKGKVTAVQNSLRRTRNNITTNLANLATAVSEQNLGKYGYTIGDYFEGASGYTYVLADYNTFKGTATPYCIAGNHLGIVVVTHATSEWHTEAASAVGYNGSTLHSYLKTTVLDNIKADFKALFGGSTGLEHLIAHTKLLTTALANWAWQNDQYISALTCTQIDAGSQWTANGFQEGEASKSLELFRKYKWTEIFGGEYPWLRNIGNYDNSAGSACLVHGAGYLDGDNGVAGSAFVVGLIMFN